MCSFFVSGDTVVFETSYHQTYSYNFNYALYWRTAAEAFSNKLNRLEQQFNANLTYVYVYGKRISIYLNTSRYLLKHWQLINA